MNKIRPIPGSPQERFCKSPVRELGYGGAAGGAKSYGLILDVLYQLPKQGYNAIIFRRTYKQLMEAGGLIDYSLQVYPSLGGVFNQSTYYTWKFPNYHNNTIRFSYIEREADIENHSGSAYAYIGFDELGTFTERQYLFLFSRNRCTSPGVDLYVRSTFNPGGVGHHWIKNRFIKPFLNGNSFTSEPKYFKRIGGQDTETSPDDPLAVSRLFIPAKLEDNPYLWNAGDSDYERNLNQLDTVDFQRLRFGDWDIRRTGIVYHSFSDKNIGPHSDDLDYSKSEGYWHSHDFGAVNHVWGLWVRIGDQYFLVHEQKLPEGTTASRAAIINDKLSDKKVVAGWGGAGSEKQYRLDFTNHGVPIRTPPTMIKSSGDEIVESQIRNVNKMFEETRLIICRNMVYTLDDIENCVRGQNGEIVDKATHHFCDMVRYFGAGISTSGWVR